MRFMASAPKGFLVRASSVSLQPRRGRRAPRWTGSAARHRPEMEGKSGAQACAEFLVVPMAFVRLLPGPDRQEGHSGKEQGTCPAPGGPGLLAEEPGSAARKVSPRCSEGSGSADAFKGRGSAALAVLARLLRLLRLLLSADSPVFLFSFSRFSGSGSSSASKMETGKNCLGSFTKLRCCSASSRLRFAGGCAGCEAACSAARVQERGSTSEENTAALLRDSCSDNTHRSTRSARGRGPEPSWPGTGTRAPQRPTTRGPRDGKGRVRRSSARGWLRALRIFFPALLRSDSRRRPSGGLPRKSQVTSSHTLTPQRIRNAISRGC